jgi:hypothetical protein
VFLINRYSRSLILTGHYVRKRSTLYQLCLFTLKYLNLWIVLPKYDSSFWYALCETRVVLGGCQDLRLYGLVIGDWRKGHSSPLRVQVNPAACCCLLPFYFGVLPTASCSHRSFGSLFSEENTNDNFIQKMCFSFPRA